MPRLRTGILCLALLACCGTSLAGIYDESIDGDISGDRLAPTAFALDFGSNPLTAASQSGDLEYVTITVPGGFSLDAVVLSSFDSTDDIAFSAVQSGSTFTEDPATANPANILGLTHFGTAIDPDVTLVGDDLLDNMGEGTFGGMGFTQPLPSGDYTFWLQQTTPALTTYTLDFVVTPEPAAGLFAAAGSLLVGRRRRNSLEAVA